MEGDIVLGRADELIHALATAGDDTAAGISGRLDRASDPGGQGGLSLLRQPAAGLDPHFYSAAEDECDAVKQKFPDAWIFEGSDVFQMVFPDRTTGSCPDGTVPVYRLFNQRTDVNHRYTTDPAVQAQMIAKGYVPEGYGAGGVAMCTLA